MITADRICLFWADNNRNMSSEEKKKRGRNFSEAEELVLVELLEKRRSVLENKKSDAATWKQKVQAWEEMAHSFYTRTGVRREWKALRDKFINMKRRAKMEIGEEQAYSIRRRKRKFFAATGDSATGLSPQFGSDNFILPNETGYDGEDDMFESSTDEHDVDGLMTHKKTSSEWSSLNPRTLRSLHEEKIKLVLLQQEFYKGENQRAQEKHDQEIVKEKLKLEQEVKEGKLRIELMQLDILEKRTRLDMKFLRNRLSRCKSNA
ncbi:uncharacterized protein LOC6563990 isoform X1 [Drosophila grimshawi]|uniref:uncharacterized protein LOC6563990 isoform X1 n=2 Tax=Drosophila grimshawi TaxID=7222 RepID=UPI000C86E58F|nr:uncharacterized protein LOC6563990 isoform X1 [Drosophila grimshawi]